MTGTTGLAQYVEDHIHERKSSSKKARDNTFAECQEALHQWYQKILYNALVCMKGKWAQLLAPLFIIRTL